jgi:tetratricopeptide (TPR) repeat protein
MPFSMTRLFTIFFLFISGLIVAQTPSVESGYKKLNNRNFEGAIREFSQILMSQPDNVDAFCGRAEAKLNVGDYSGALKDVEQALSLDINNGLVYSLRGDIYYYQKDYTNALKFYNEALQKQNSPIQAIVGKAKVMNQLGKTKEGYAILDDAILAQPGSAELLYARGLLNNTKEKYSKALDDFEKAFELNSEYNKYGNFLNRGYSFQCLEEYDKAIELYGKAIELDPRSASAYNSRGLAYYATSNYKEASSDFIKALEINPNAPGTMYNLGMAYYKMEDKENACISFQKASDAGDVNSKKMLIMYCSGN